MKERKSHGVQLLIRCVVRDPDGKVISDTGQKPAKSFVIQTLEFIYFMAAGVTGNATDITGAEQAIYSHINTSPNSFLLRAPVNDDGYGIVVGTGDTAATNTDFALDTQLTEGVGAGNITHGAQVVGAPAVVGANVDMELTRAFTNLTGNLITVTEAGAYVVCLVTRHHCVIRDVLGAPVEVPNMCSLTVIYTVRTTV